MKEITGLSERGSNRNSKAIFKREAREVLSENVTLKLQVQGGEEAMICRFGGSTFLEEVRAKLKPLR